MLERLSQRLICIQQARSLWGCSSSSLTRLWHFFYPDCGWHSCTLICAELEQWAGEDANMNRCEIIEVRNSADELGFPCSRTASTQCSDCGSELCESHAETCGACSSVFCPSPLCRCSFHHVSRT